MNATLCFGSGNTLDPVDAGFVFQVAEDFFPGDFENDLLEAADIRG
jgi:hypothetical protein